MDNLIHYNQAARSRPTFKDLLVVLAAEDWPGIVRDTSASRGVKTASNAETFLEPGLWFVKRARPDALPTMSRKSLQECREWMDSSLQFVHRPDISPAADNEATSNACLDALARFITAHSNTRQNIFDDGQRLDVVNQSRAIDASDGSTYSDIIIRLTNASNPVPGRGVPQPTTSDIVVIEGKTLTVFLAHIKEIENHIDSVVRLPAVTASSPKWLVVLNQVSTYDVVVRTQH